MVKIKNKDIPKHEVEKLSSYLKKKQDKQEKLSLNELWTLERFISEHSSNLQPSAVMYLHQIISKLRRLSQ